MTRYQYQGETLTGQNGQVLSAAAMPEWYGITDEQMDAMINTRLDAVLRIGNMDNGQPE